MHIRERKEGIHVNIQMYEANSNNTPHANVKKIKIIKNKIKYSDSTSKVDLISVQF